MQPEWEPAQEPAARRVWSSLLAPLAAEMAIQADGLAARAVEHMRAKLPELYPDDDTLETTLASAREHVMAIADMLQRGAAPRPTELPAATIADARARARRGISVAPLMRNYRLGHELIWNWMLDELCARTGDARELASAVQLASAWLFAYMDAAAALGEQFYTAEQERWMRSAAASRAETIEALLSGEERDLARGSSRLRYELGRDHLALIAWTSGSDDAVDPQTALENAVLQLQDRVGADGVLLHPLGSLTTAAWLSKRGSFDLRALDAAPFQLTGTPGARVACGEPATGISGFRQSHAEALHTRRVAVLLRRSPGTITRYTRIALVAMATADAEQARLFVERTLGPLAADDDVARRLSATLGAYLDENASRGRAAKRLGVHENTISYRVRQAEELLGRSVDHDTLGLRVALSLSPALRDAGTDA